MIDNPRAAVEELAACQAPFLVGVRHHAPSLAAVVPELLDAARPDVLLVELPPDFAEWVPWLAHADTVAPVALAAAGPHGLSFYPFADFSPELAALRWAAARGIPVVACDLPLADRAWADAGSPAGRGVHAALRARTSGRDDDLWDRLVEAPAPGSSPEAVRRAALAVGWALRADAVVVGEGDLRREAAMRAALAQAVRGGARAAMVVGAFHAPALTPGYVPPDVVSSEQFPSPVPAVAPPPGAGDSTSPSRAAAPTTPTTAAPAPRNAEATPVVTSLIPYTYPLLDSRSGYPSGIRDPEWQHSVLAAHGDPTALHDSLTATAVRLCAALRTHGHPSGPADAREITRVAADLAALRGLPAPGRGEFTEAVETVLTHGETLGRGRSVARALDDVLVGRRTGRPAPAAPRSGLAPAVEHLLADLGLPGPGTESDTPRDLRLDPLRGGVDLRREVLLNRLDVCAVPYGERRDVTGTGGVDAVSTRWTVSWTPGTHAMLQAAGVRGVTPRQAAEGILRERLRREHAEGGPTAAAILTGLTDSARCALPDLVRERLAELDTVLPAVGTLPELLDGLALLDRLAAGHVPGLDAIPSPGTTEALTEACVRRIEGLTGSDDEADARALVDLALRADSLGGVRLTSALAALARDGSPLMRGCAGAVRVLLGHETAAELGGRAGSWVDAAGTPEGRAEMRRGLSGLLSAAGPLLQAGGGALDGVVERVAALGDREFLDRLPALRGAFDTLSPADRGRLLEVVEERVGDVVETIEVDAGTLAAWTAADVAARDALAALGLVAPAAATGDSPGAAPEPPATVPGPDAKLPASSLTSPAGSPRLPLPSPSPSLPAADRWRLVLGRRPERLPAHARRIATALDELYGTGRGEGSRDIPGNLGGPGNRGGREKPFPGVREWADELLALFGPGVREEVLAAAVASGRTDAAYTLDPAAARPSVELLRTILAYAGGLPESRIAALRPLVARIVDELTRELATRMRPALTGLTTPRPSTRPGGGLDLGRTVRANLATAHSRPDGTGVLVVPERPVFRTRARRSADWRLILVVDVSGSMEASTVWSALTASILAGVPALTTHFLAFSTEVVDLTEHVHDPLSLLLDVQVGGGTHIAAGLRAARDLVTVPSHTLVAVVSDFEEGFPIGGLLSEVRALVGAGVHVLGCASLDDAGRPRYSTAVAAQLVAAGMPVAALSPTELARWVGEKVT